MSERTRKRRAFSRCRAALAFAAAMATVAAGRARAEQAGPAALPDTVGAALMEWSYDSWTVPWVQVRGTSRLLAPASHVTFMVLACESSALERDRRVRHLSAEECEHRMAAIRADQDSALIFRLDLRVFDEPGASGLIRIGSTDLGRYGPRAEIVLEDDRGRHWYANDVKRGIAFEMASGQKLERTYVYHPPWLRSSEHAYPHQYWPRGGRSLTLVEHRARIPRRDPRTGEPLIDGRTRWVRLHLDYGANEWVATWTFIPQEGRRP